MVEYCAKECSIPHPFFLLLYSSDPPVSMDRAIDQPVEFSLTAQRRIKANKGITWRGESS